MIVCIGAFDGYHRGHAALFERARELAEQFGTDWRLLTFEPHPRFVLGGLTARLFTEQEKACLRRAYGISDPIEVPFTKEFADTEPGEFLDELCGRLSVTGIVVGDEFRFGRGRSGNGAFLRDYCTKCGLFLELVPQKFHCGAPISSTRVRETVSEGNMALAAELLGYPYFMQAPVESGERRGRTLGFPTANLACAPDKLLPGEGVYAGAAWLDGWQTAAVSVGSNPTFFHDQRVRIEAHLIGFSGDLYGKDLFLAFLRRLRPMRKFGSSEELKGQLAKDCEQVRELSYDDLRRLTVLSRAFAV